MNAIKVISCLFRNGDDRSEPEAGIKSVVKHLFSGCFNDEPLLPSKSPSKAVDVFNC